MPPWCVSILDLKVEAVQGKQFPWNGLRLLQDSGNIDMTLEFVSTFLWRAPPLEMRAERREFFSDHAGKGSLLSSKRQKRGSSGCGWDSRASCGVETGMSGNFLSCSNGVKDPLEVRRLGLISLETPQHEWASSRLEGRTSWTLSSCGRLSFTFPETQLDSMTIIMNPVEFTAEIPRAKHPTRNIPKMGEVLPVFLQFPKCWASSYFLSSGTL